MSATSLCEICQQAQAMMVCSICGDLQCCFVCISKRHQYGQLRTHSFTLLHNDTYTDPKLGNECQWCEMEPSTVKCNLCVMVFCKSCAEEFHEFGGGLFLSHNKSFILSKKLSSNKRRLSLNVKRAHMTESETNDNNHNDNNNNNNNASPSAQYLLPDDSPPVRHTTTLSPQNSFKDLHDLPPNATFRLAAYGLGIADTKLASSNEGGKIQYYITFDYAKKILTIYGKSDNSLILSNSRSFYSIKQVVSGTDLDQRRLSIYFNDSRPVAQLLAMNKDEGIQIKDLIQNITHKEYNAVSSAKLVPLYSGPAFKRGKMSWSRRWITLDQHKFHVFKKKDTVVPTHSIVLNSRVVIEPDKLKVKQFIIHTPERKYMFKVYSQFERDTIVSLLIKASEREAKKARDSVGSREGALLELSKRMSLVIGVKANQSSLDKSTKSTQPSRQEALNNYLERLRPNTVFTPARPKNFDSLLDKLGSEQSGNRTIEFLEERIPEKQHKPFSRVVTHGVYRLMSILCESMNQGAKLSNNIFVPKSVWYQQGAKFIAYPVKIESFETLQQEMLHMNIELINEDVYDFVQYLVSFRIAADEVQNRLAQHLTFIHSVKKPVSKEVDISSKTKSSASKFMSSIRKKVTRGVNAAAKDKVGDTTKYVRLLSSVLQSSELFESWINLVETDKYDDIWGSNAKREVEGHLLAISEFFHGVVCNVVVRDMKKVIKRYLKHCARSLAS